MRTRIDTPDGDVTGPKLACLHHLEPPYPGCRRWRRCGARGWSTSDRLGGDPLPDLEAVDGLVTFGGAESVTEIDRYPYLLEEAELLREAVAGDVPVLGICLGAQVLAHALGGSVRRLPRRAVRWVELARIADDELLPDPVWALHWNEDAHRAAARRDRAARARRARLRRVPHRQRVGRAVPRRRRRRRRSTAGTTRYGDWLARGGRRARRPRRAADARAPPRPAGDRGGDLRRLRQTRSSSAKPCAEVSSVTCVRRDSSRSAPVSTSRQAPASSSGSSSVDALRRAHRHDDQHLALAAHERARRPRPPSTGA